MSQKTLYFSKSETKTVLLIPETWPPSLAARMLTIQKKKQKFTILLTLCDREEATHIPLATYTSMEDAIADMEKINQSMLEDDAPEVDL